METSLWQTFSTLLNLNLPPGEVHLWFSPLEAAEDGIARYANFLSKEELEKASQFYFEKDKKRFIQVRGILRLLLAKYLEEKPHRLVFTRNRYGKLYLSKSSSINRIYFNLSHSGGFVLIGFSRNFEIGVDLERMDRQARFDRIIHKHFTDREKSMFEGISQREKRLLFYRLWTCKEAFMKGVGKGFYLALKEIEISIREGSELFCGRSKKDPQLSDWHLKLLNPPVADSMGAVAIQHSIPTFKYHQLSQLFSL